MNTRSIGPLITGSVLLLICVLPPVGGRSQSSGTKAVDIILIFDKSERSDSDSFKGERNKRINLIKSMALSFMPDDLGNKVSIISYGDGAPSTIRLAEFSEPSDLLLRLESEFNDKPSSFANANESDVAAALIAARRLKNKGRGMVIVLVTPIEPSQNKMKEVKTRLKELKDESVAVQVIFTGETVEASFWEQQESDGLIELKNGGSDQRDREQLFDIEDRLASLLKFNTGENQGTQYNCPPFLRRLVIKVTADSSQHLKKLLVFAPDKRLLPPVQDLSKNGDLVMFNSYNPLPGNYEITGINEKNVAIQIEEYPPFLEKKLPGGEVYPLLEEEVVFALKLKPNQDLEPRWVEEKTKVEVNMTTDDPRVQLEPMTMNYSDRTLKGSYKFPVPGLYKIYSLSPIPIPGPGGPRARKDILLKNDAPSIEVNSQFAYSLRLQPDVFEVNPFTSNITLRFGLEASNNKSGLELTRGITDPDTWIKLQLYDINSQKAGDPIPLDETDGSFTAELTLPRLLNPLDGFKTRDTVYFKINNRDNSDIYRNQPFVYSIISGSGPLATSITQDRRSPVGNLTIEIIWWVWIAAGSILLLLLLLVIVLLNEYILLPRKIRREDEKKNRTVMLKIYDQEEDPAGFQPKSIPLETVIRMKLDKRVIIPTGRGPLCAKRFRLRRLHSNGPAEAIIKYRWQGSSKTFKTRLRAGKLSKLESGNPVDYWSPVATLEEV